MCGTLVRALCVCVWYIGEGTVCVCGTLVRVLHVCGTLVRALHALYHTDECCICELY